MTKKKFNLNITLLKSSPLSYDLVGKVSHQSNLGVSRRSQRSQVDVTISASSADSTSKLSERNALALKTLPEPMNVPRKYK